MGDSLSGYRYGCSLLHHFYSVGWTAVAAVDVVNARYETLLYLTVLRITVLSTAICPARRDI